MDDINTVRLSGIEAELVIAGLGALRMLLNTVANDDADLPNKLEEIRMLALRLVSETGVAA